MLSITVFDRCALLGLSRVDPQVATINELTFYWLCWQTCRKHLTWQRYEIFLTLPQVLKRGLYNKFTDPKVRITD